MTMWNIAAGAIACTACDSVAGHRLRSAIFDANFAANLLAVALPFPILIGVAVVAHFGWPTSRRGKGKGQ